MEKAKKSIQIPNDKKLAIIVAVCLIAMIGLILGIMLSVKLSIFATVSDVYTLSGDYKITQEDIDKIGKGDGTLGLDYACVIDLNGYTLDLNGYEFGMASSETGKSIKVINGTIKNGKFTINAENCAVAIDKVNFACDYKVNTKNSDVKLTNLNVDASKVNVIGGELSLDNANVSGNIALQSDLTVNDSNVPSVTVQNVTTTINGTLNGSLTLNEGAIVNSYASIAKVDANDGSKLTLKKISGGKGEEILGSNVNELNVNGSSDIKVENCANVDTLNINNQSKVEIAGTANDINVNGNGATLTATKSAIANNVKINVPSTIDFLGTATNLNVNSSANVDLGASSYVKFLNINNPAGGEAATVSEDGKVAVINVAQENCDLTLNRDASISYIVCSNSYIFENKTKSSINKYMQQVTEISDDVNNAAENFEMPITYVTSDCQGNGYIDYSKGGKRDSQEIREEDLNKVGHSYVYTIVKRPTTEETGIGRYTCECGDCYDVELPVRRIVLDAPTLIDLFGVDVKAGVYNLGLDDGSCYSIDKTDFMATSTRVDAGPIYMAKFDKAYLQVTVEKDNVKNKVNLYGDAQLKLTVYAGITSDQKAVLENAQTESEVQAPTPTYAIDVQVLMRGEKIYVYMADAEAEKSVFDVYDIVNCIVRTYLGKFVNITLEDVVNIINISNKVDNLTTQYDAAVTVLVNEIINNTNFGKILPTFDCVDEENGTYSLNVAKIFTQFGEFGDQALAQYIDSIVGAGTVSSLIDLIDGIYDYKVNDIWDVLVLFASNGGMDEVMLLEDADTLLSCIRDDVYYLLSDSVQYNMDSYIAMFYDEENEVYSVEYALNKYGNYTLYEALNGKLAADASPEAIDKYKQDKEATEEKAANLALELEEALYDYTVFEFVGILSQGKVPATLFESIIESGIANAEYYDISWTLTAEDELKEISVDIYYPAEEATTTSEEPTEDTLRQAFGITYNAVSNEYTRLYVDVETPFAEIFIDYNEKETNINIAVAPHVTLQYESNAKASQLVLSMRDGKYRVVEEAAKVEGAEGFKFECKDYATFKEFFDALKLTDLTSIYNEIKSRYISIVGRLDIDVDGTVYSILKDFYPEIIKDRYTRGFSIDTEKDTFTWFAWKKTTDDNKEIQIVDLSTLKDNYVEFYDAYGAKYDYSLYTKASEDGRSIKVGIGNQCYNSDDQIFTIINISLDNGIEYDHLFCKGSYYEKTTDKNPAALKTYYVYNKDKNGYEKFKGNEFVSNTEYFEFIEIALSTNLLNKIAGQELKDENYGYGFKFEYCLDPFKFEAVYYNEFSFDVKLAQHRLVVTNTSFDYELYYASDYFYSNPTPSMNVKAYYSDDEEAGGYFAEINRSSNNLIKCNNDSTFNKNLKYYNENGTEIATLTEEEFNSNKTKPEKDRATYYYLKEELQTITGFRHIGTTVTGGYTYKFYSYDETKDETPDTNKVYYTLADGEYSIANVSTEFAKDTTYYEFVEKNDKNVSVDSVWYTIAPAKEEETFVTFVYQPGKMLNLSSHEFTPDNYSIPEEIVEYIDAKIVEIEDGVFQNDVHIEPLVLKFFGITAYEPLEFRAITTYCDKTFNDVTYKVIESLFYENINEDSETGINYVNSDKEFLIEFGSVEISETYDSTSVYVKTIDTVVSSNKTYYTYDNDEEKYVKFVGEAFVEETDYYELRELTYVKIKDSTFDQDKTYYTYSNDEEKYVEFDGEEFVEEIDYYELRELTYDDYEFNPILSYWTNKVDSNKVYIDFAPIGFNALIEDNYQGTTGVSVTNAGITYRALFNAVTGNFDIYYGTKDGKDVTVSALVVDGEEENSKEFTLVINNDPYTFDLTLDETTDTYTFIDEESQVKYEVKYAINEKDFSFNLKINDEEIADIVMGYDYGDTFAKAGITAKVKNSIVDLGAYFNADYSEEAINKAIADFEVAVAEFEGVDEGPTDSMVINKARAKIDGVLAQITSGLQMIISMIQARA